MTLSLVTPADADNPVVTLAEAKAWCEIAAEETGRDGMVLTMLLAAIGEVEGFIGRGLGEQEWTLTLDALPTARTIELPVVPLISVDAVTYLDEDGAAQSLDAADYASDLLGNPGRVVMGADASWPTTFDGPNAVTIEFTAGYTADTLPAPIKSAVLQLVAQQFDERTSGDMPQGVARLLSPFRRIVI